MGRPTLKVRFNGAPMHAKVQGTALIAYLPGQFIQITGVEGRTYLDPGRQAWGGRSNRRRKDAAREADSKAASGYGGR